MTERVQYTYTGTGKTGWSACPLDATMVKTMTDEVMKDDDGPPEPLPDARKETGNPYLRRIYERTHQTEADLMDDDWAEGHWMERRSMIKVYSWAIPNDKAITLLRHFSPLIEIGAGTGYWAWMVERKDGGKVYAYDTWHSQYPASMKWVNVKRGGPAMIKHRRDATLFLCWPPYDTPMAWKCLTNYTGEFFLYEGEGTHGCTGDDDFHAELSMSWNLKDMIAVPRWPGISDTLMLYKRIKKRSKK